MVEEIRVIKDSRVEVLDVKWSRDDGFLAACFADGLIKIYSASTFRIIRLLSIRTITKMPITSLCWNPDRSKKSLSVVSSDGCLASWNIESGKLTKFGRLSAEQGLCISHSPNGLFVAVGTNSFEIEILSADHFKPECTLLAANDTRQGHTNRIYAVKWTDNKHLFSGGWDDYVFLWDLESCEVLRAFYKAHVCGSTLDYCDNFVLVGSNDRKDHIQVYDYNTNQITFADSIGGTNNARVFGCQFSKSGGSEYIAAAGDQLKIYRTEGFAQIYAESYEGIWFCCDWAHNENLIALGNSEGAVKIVSVNEH